MNTGAGVGHDPIRSGERSRHSRRESEKEAVK
jgi:hypothetical protein